MHLQYDGGDDVLYWTEAYAHLATGSATGALGALAVRRLKFATYEVDYYAGNVGTFRAVIGKTVGYRDGPVDQAIFRLPTALAFYSNLGIWGTGPLMYVCDNGNSAIRRVATVVNTRSPTVSPTISIKPTFSPTISLKPTPNPTSSPTNFPTTTPTGVPSTSVPSASPSSSHPTLFPTPEPTGIPTAIPTISLAPTIFHAPTGSPTELDGDCLEILLLDEFGDGWSGLALYINHTGYISSEYVPIYSGPGPKGKPKKGDEGVYFSSTSYSPTLESNPLIFRVCASLHQDRYRDRGNYILEINHVPGQPTRNDWEIIWQVATQTKDYNNWIYADKKTKIEFEFKDDGEFHLIKLDHEVKDPNDCSSCKHPPPPKKNNNNNDDNDDNNNGNINPTPAPKPVDPNPKDHLITYELYDSEGDGWFYSQLSTRFSISDDTKTKLLSFGTLCGEHDKEVCASNLEDGDYYFRIGGAGDVNKDEVSWNFCGVQGKAMQELSFAIVHGKCVAGHLSNAIEMIGAKEQTTITMRGELLLENVFSNDLSIAESRIFESVIAQVLSIDSSEVMILSVCQTKPGVYCSTNDDDEPEDPKKRKLPPPSSSLPSPSNKKVNEHRILSPTYVLDVVFLVTLVAEKYNKVGSQLHSTMSLFQSKEEIFEEAFKSGQLQSTLRNSDHDSLAFVRLQHMIPLKHADLSYKFVSITNSPTPSPRNEQPLQHIILDESLEQTALIATPVLFIGLAFLIIGFIVARERLSNTQNSSSLVTTTETKTTKTETNNKHEKIPNYEKDATLNLLSSELTSGEQRYEENQQQHQNHNYNQYNQLGGRGGTEENGEEEELTLELRSDLSYIPSHPSSRSRYRKTEGIVTGEGGILSDSDIIPMLNIRANDNQSNLRDNGSLEFDIPISTSRKQANSPV
eukprot:CAMPEP_0174821890 /NCGR_PEP_ID=MMETSP1107-20130205/10998_1 /TAXON_ID=36770 /ORGANISM="Paraphysomonas vestita, Strain GFlagA" /LENGTH=910 /DNA_ID=CAMNT_0016039459 /DNA_START=897 /DNA_END=3629 /DNA_ORIENTATION=-